MGETCARDDAPTGQKARATGRKNAKPVGFILRGDGCVAMVVPETATKDDLPRLLADLVSEEFGGDPFSPNNPAIVKAVGAGDARVEWWFSCSKAYREEFCEDPYMDDWWSSDGDGRRSMRVVVLHGSAYVLGEDCEEHEPEPSPVGVPDA